MINYSKYKTSLANPEASSMIETFRAIGYSLESAVADIIDNSISAAAKNIWVDYDWKGPGTMISIIDDGAGMNNEELINAMRPGSRHPLEVRKENDLGRFGLGLKTASFSQCRKFSVISKPPEGKVSYWCWDIDYVTQSTSWSLINYCPDNKFETEIEKLNSGTAVIWWEIDRITKDTSADSSESLDKFMKQMENVKIHLSMVFHRFINDGLNIYFRGRKISSWDPFMIGFDGLQAKPEMKIGNGKITLKGYVLPHRSKLTTEQYEYGKGPKESWTAHQGFYVYRNKRLLVAGDWLGFFKKEVHYDLCRIFVDIPNDVDDDWQIDIKKSIARPPLRFREQIYSLAKDVRAQALEVYRHKGRVIKRRFSNEEFHQFWEERKRHGKRFYKINRDHPMLRDLFGKANSLKSDIEKVIQFIEETVPVPLITLQENENNSPHGQPFEGIDQEPVRNTMIAMFSNLVKQGKSADEAKAVILNIEPFNFFPEYLEYLKDSDNAE
ncbi:MAG: ATP-binding protein [Prolixibacteraceae bacterium]|nr:ATP-binding protein [Prolixibacteraceae bacterium]